MLLKGQLFSVRLAVWVLNVFLRICCPVILAQDSAIRFLWRRSKKNKPGGSCLPQSRFKRLPIYWASTRPLYGAAAGSMGFDASRKIQRLHTACNPFFEMLSSLIFVFAFPPTLQFSRLFCSVLENCKNPCRTYR